MDRSNPYEAAFEAYLQNQGLCYIGIDEQRRALFNDTPIKNLDFIVLGRFGSRLLVDVKGRQFPGGPTGKERYVWENWATQDDIAGIDQWMKLLGPSYLGLFVFLYRLRPTVALPEETPDLWTWQNDRFLLRAITVDQYRKHLKVRSPRWGTVGLASAQFQQLVRPFRYFTHELPGEGEYDQDQTGPLSEVARHAIQTLAHGSAEAGSDGD